MRSTVRCSISREGFRSGELVALDRIANELKFVLMDAQLYEFSARSLSAGK
jgi:hypothetical protein